MDYVLSWIRLKEYLLSLSNVYSTYKGMTGIDEFNFIYALRGEVVLPRWIWETHQYIQSTYTH